MYIIAPVLKHNNTRYTKSCLLHGKMTTRTADGGGHPTLEAPTATATGGDAATTIMTAAHADTIAAPEKTVPDGDHLAAPPAGQAIGKNMNAATPNALSEERT